MTNEEFIKQVVETLRKFQDPDGYPDINGSFDEEDREDSEYWRELIEDKYTKQPVMIEGITFHYMDDYGGMGLGDEYWFVSEVTIDNDTRYVRWDGYYNSWDGFEVEPEDCTVVEPREVMRVEWVRVK